MNETDKNNTALSAYDNERSISLVVASSTNNVIGKNNQLVWHLPNDMKFFKNTTWGFPVVMGRKTFEALHKPLPGRFNVVITSSPDWSVAGAIAALNIDDAIKIAGETNARKIFIIGGGEVYKQSMVIADTIYLTRVHAVLEGDTFFPAIDEAEWGLASNDDFPADAVHAYPYSFQVWKKK